jgi:hypothetical protein
LHMQETPEPSHAADALAIGLCYLQSRQLEQRFGISSRSIENKTARTRMNPVAAMDATAGRAPRISSHR